MDVCDASVLKSSILFDRQRQIVSDPQDKRFSSFASPKKKATALGDNNSDSSNNNNNNIQPMHLPKQTA